MKTLKVLSFVILIALGVLMFVYAEADDSPGGQLLGLLAAVLGLVGVYRVLRR